MRAESAEEILTDLKSDKIRRKCLSRLKKQKLFLHILKSFSNCKDSDFFEIFPLSKQKWQFATRHFTDCMRSLAACRRNNMAAVGETFC